jgi:hypothetical protein
MKRKNKRELTRDCDLAEKAYFEAVQALPEWQAYQEARDDGLPGIADLKERLNQVINDLPQWRDYQEAWLELEVYMELIKEQHQQRQQRKQKEGVSC